MANGGAQTRICFICDCPDHFKADCPYADVIANSKVKTAAVQMKKEKRGKEDRGSCSEEEKKAVKTIGRQGVIRGKSTADALADLIYTPKGSMRIPR